MGTEMSDIKAGDLVVVISPDACCPNTSDIGVIFKVAVVEYVPSHYLCHACGSSARNVPHAYYAEDDTYFELASLKKIDPSRDEDFVETTEELEDVSVC